MLRGDPFSLGRTDRFQPAESRIDRKRVKRENRGGRLSGSAPMREAHACHAAAVHLYPSQETETERPKVSENASETVPRRSVTPTGRPNSSETDVTDTSRIPHGTMVSK